MGRLLSAAVPLAVVAALVPAGAPAAATPVRTLASHCSPSGDVCYGVIVRHGVVRFEITTAARYFPRYTLCVRPPGTGAVGRLRCGSFPIFDRRTGARGSVRFRRQFPGGGPGVYRVTWRLGQQALGPTLRFRLPLG